MRNRRNYKKDGFRMTNFKDLPQYGKKFLSGADLSGQTKQATIASADLEDVGQQGQKIVVRFVNGTKGLVLNNSQYEVMVKAYGYSGTDWVGKTISLAPRELTSGMFAGKFTIDVSPVQAEQPDPEIPF